MELLVYLTTNEVDDEAAVAVAAGGAAAEESHAVGRAHDDVEDVVPPEDDGVVAGVREGVAEGEVVVGGWLWGLGRCLLQWPAARPSMEP